MCKKGTNSPTSPGSSCPIDETTKACANIPKGCEYLNKPFTVEAPQSDFDRIRSPSTIGPAKAIQYTFPGDNAPQDAFEQEVDVKGHKVKVITPKNPPANGKKLPTADEITKSLGAVPDDQLNSIQTVVDSPNPNPSDAYWAQQYNTPNFSSAATGGNKTVTFYPQDSFSQPFTDSTMIHEGGHAYSQDLWNDAAKKQAWQNAINSDQPNSPSKYADNSIGEDFSESLVMYSLSKGTPCEATAKKLYPNRYKLLDSMFAKGTSK